LWRYNELLPVQDSQQLSMGEGWTPLLHAERLGTELGLPRLSIKDERRSPTSSFKDRQAVLAVSALKAAGVKECVMASTGNASTAYAAYCARAGIKLWVFVTSLVPSAKMREAALYGAEVIKVTGSYDQTKQVAADFAARRGLHLEGGPKTIPSKESMKTIAFEIAEQMGWQPADWYIQAVSGGIGPIGVWKGFVELKEMGLIKRLPRLAIVQVDGCAPMVRAFAAGKEKADPVIPKTEITILSTGDPGYGYTILYNAAHSNGGTMVSVSDEAAFRAMRHLARAEGFSVEPATAVAFAGLEKMLVEGVIKPDESVLVNASGHTLPVEKFILGEQYVVDIEVRSRLAENWGMPEEGLGAALEHLDEKVTTVVVIDDNPRDSRLICRLLQARKSYRVFEANDGTAGLALVRERLPDLVILDLLMPDVDGFDVLDALKRDPTTTNIPVLVVTGKTLSKEERHRLEGQIDSVWTKGSYSTRDLVDHIVDRLATGPLPATALPSMTPAVSQPPVEPAEPAPTSGRKRTLLVVEDNPLDARLLRRTLEEYSGRYLVLEAHTGEQAVSALRQVTPDLVILDWLLPDMTGDKILELMRVDPITRDVPVILLTAKDLTAEERGRIEGRVHSTWTKASLDRAMLRERIVEVIGDSGHAARSVSREKNP
jgi:threonine synthase